MSLFGFIGRAINEARDRQMVLSAQRDVLADPARVHAIGEMSKALIEAGGLDARDALLRVLAAVPAGEIELLDTHEGRTAVLCDAMEALFAAPVVRARAAR